MSELKPISHKKFIMKLKKFGFTGPYEGGKHLYMLKSDIRLTIPNPHKRKDIGVDLLSKIL
ncbi:MAG: type II toxin-antitoxin system HicA family toxin [Caldisericia bacterium]|nr:type II toxin-antitoxin system HicA family toxin [Caldisericia bacterium]MDD3428070.1 type II toxin-antitoxin system HicA family toxin [Caldisericia bacterium]MDD5689608.1 type II toxin-antitoxin system HicA family toxin [Caldisericia bacterium]